MRDGHFPLRNGVVAEPFASWDQLEVRALILSYLTDRFGALDSTLNPDLDDIAASYAKGHVLVARLDSRVVGTGILVPEVDGSAEIKRMCVARDVRRRGIGSRILHALIEQAGRDGVRRIVVYTATAWEDAVSFYSGAGFTVSRYEQNRVHFRRRLHARALIASRNVHRSVRSRVRSLGVRRSWVVGRPARLDRCPTPQRSHTEGA